MSLNWSLDKIKDYETLCWVESILYDGEAKRLSPVTNELIWATMDIGIKAITPDNFKLFHRRLLERSIIEQKKTVTLKDVYDHIGLRTNAVSKTANQWKTRLMTQISADAKTLHYADDSLPYVARIAGKYYTKEGIEG